MSVVFDPVDHSYMDGERKLHSVTSIIRECYPIAKNFDGADPAVLENARVRGVAVDTYFTEYLKTGAVTIPVGETEDVKERIVAVVEWWESEKRCAAEPQMLLTDGEIAGTCDWMLAETGQIWDMKNVSKLDSSYPIQVAAYCQLFEAQYGLQAHGGSLLHVSRISGKVRVKAVPIDMEQAMNDWFTIRRYWKLKQRLTK